MMNASGRKLFGYCVLLSGFSLGLTPMFMDLQVFKPIIIAVALVLIMCALIGLRRPKHVRLPRRRTFS
jgi:hypothetical protein